MISDIDFLTFVNYYDDVDLSNVENQYFDDDNLVIIFEKVKEFKNKHKSVPKDLLKSLVADCDSVIINIVHHITKLHNEVNNLSYIVDECKKWIILKSNASYADRLYNAIENENLIQIENLRSEKRVLSDDASHCVDFLKDDLELDTGEEELVTLGNVSSCFGRIKRGDFISILAPMKTGKTFALQEISKRCLLQGLNVVFFSLEMQQVEVVTRFYKMFFGRRSGLIDAGNYQTYNIENGELVEQNVIVNEKLNVPTEQLQKELKSLSSGGSLKIITYPMMSVTVEEIIEKIESLISNNYIPDVICIDYADIIKKSGGGYELRNQLDYIWQMLRFYAMSSHTVIFTASQTNRGALGKEVEGQSVAEDVRKIAHVTSFVALEQTNEMRKFNIMRMKNLFMRNGRAGASLTFTQALDLGRFIHSDVYNSDDLELFK